MLRTMQCLALLVSIFCGLMFADQITLNNGDHLTGKIVKSDGKTIVVHTDSAGDVTINLSAVKEITTDQDLHVELKNGKSATGPATLQNGDIDVTPKNAPSLQAPTGDITVIRNPAEQAAYEKSLHPGWLQGWNGGINVGFSTARGNSETENLAIGFNAAHPTLNDNLVLSANSIYTRNDLATPSIVANIQQGAIRYDHNASALIFGFVSASFMSDALQNLDLRQVYSAGIGFHAIKSANTTLDILAGANYTHETYSNGALVLPVTTPPAYVSYGYTNRFAALTLGENYMHKTKSTVINEALNFYPDLSDTGEYRMEFNLGTVTKINKWLGWQNQFSDIYVSNPPPATKKNDLIFTTGLNISFSH